VGWVSSSTADPFQVKSRPITRPLASAWSLFTTLAPTVRSYTLSGLSNTREYELVVRSPSFGPYVVRGKPL
jgi:hypothetical protein